MNVREIIHKVKENDNRSGSDRIELPKEHPLRRIWNYGVKGERIRISEYVEQDEGYEPINKEDILLQDLVSNYSDEDGIPPPYFEEVDERVREVGIEALASYVPFHYETVDRPWGIHLTDKGIWTVVRALKPLRKDNFVTNDLLVFGARILFWHEFFHFLTEIAASTMEITSNFHRNNYREYTEKIYSGDCDWSKFRFNGSHKLSRKGYALEEALANAYCYREGQKQKGVAACLQPFMRKQPPGYSNYDLFPWKRNRFRSGCSTLGSLLSDTKNTEDGSPYESLFDIYRNQVTTTDVPVYLARSPKNELGEYSSVRIFKWEPPRKEKWVEHSNFKREWKKITRGKSEAGLRAEYQTSKGYAASPDQNDRDRVEVKRIQTHENLYEFRLHAAHMRVFYQVCEGGIPVICGIKPKSQLTAKNRYNEIYRSDYCAGR